MKTTVCYLLFIMLAAISYPGVSARNHTSMCFVQYENGTVDYSISKMCSDGEHCCGKESLECCRQEGSDTSDTLDDSRWSDPYWLSRLPFKISILILAIGSGVRYLYKKCSCYKEPEHLVFVNHSIDANATFGSAANYNYGPQSPGLGQLPAYTHPNMTPYTVPNAGNMVSSVPQMGVVNSFNPYSPNNHQSDAQKPPNNIKTPS